MFENDYEFTGKHAEIVKFFVNSSQTFQRYIDVYNCAAIFGLLYNSTSEKDTTSQDRARIFADAFSNNRSDCIFVYRLVMLLEDKTGLSAEEKVDHAFRDDADETRSAQLGKDLDLFHSYIRGGLEVMKSLFLDGCASEDEYLRRAYEKFKDFDSQITGAPIEDPLAQLNLLQEGID